MTASVIPIFVGTSLSLATVGLNWSLFSATLLGAMFIQIATNLTDEYSDHVRGGSKQKFLAPHKVIEKGLLSASSILVGTLIAYAVSVTLGLYILTQTNWFILVFCVPAIFIAILYSAGPIPLGNKGISEVIVFILMGPMMVIGSYYVQTLRLTFESLLVSLPIGVLVALIMYCNNLRDLDEDASSGKTSLTSFLGKARAKRVYFTFLGSAYLLIVLSVAFQILSVWALLSLVSVPIALKSFKFSFADSERSELNSLMVHTASIHFYTGVGLAFGLTISSFL